MNNIIRDQQEENPLFEIGVRSIIGGRSYQQDFGYIYTSSQEAVAVVCDGMGGMEGGERASRKAVEVFAKDLLLKKPAVNIPGFLIQEGSWIKRWPRQTLKKRNHVGGGFLQEKPNGLDFRR